MKNENLLYEIGKIEDEIIAEAHEVVINAKKIIHYKWVRWVSVAAALALVVGIYLFAGQNKFGVENAIANIEYYSSDKLKKITVSFSAAGMGGGNIGHLIVKDYSEIASANPTRNNIGSIKELPVFKNEANLWSELNHDISLIDTLIYFDFPAYEETRDYNLFGTSSNTWNICFQFDNRKDIVDQLLDYTFYRVYYTLYIEEGVESGWSRVMTPPSKPGVLYPIISLAEATEKFRNGNFFSYGEEQLVAKTAEILSVELVYLTDENQTYLQPFYLFNITDSSWDVTSVMDGDHADEFTSVSPIYVPAVVQEYLELTEPKVNFN